MPPCRFPVLAIYIAGQVSPADIIILTRVQTSPSPHPLFTTPIDHGRCMAWASTWFLRVKAAWGWIVETELLKKHSASWCLSWPPWWSAEVRTNRQVTIRQWRIPLGVLPFFLSLLPPSCVRWKTNNLSTHVWWSVYTLMRQCLSHVYSRNILL